MKRREGKMTEEIGRFTFCVAAILEKPDEKILLVKRSPDNFPGNIWDIVGGRKEQLENPFTALTREIAEETGITDFEIVKTISDFYWFQTEASRDMVGIAFWCKTNQTEIKLSEEHTEYLWVEPTTALEMASHQIVVRCITKFLEEKKRIGLDKKK
ncbi:MAG: NUDIX domain-containing protein [Candidatus Heimdallarchaeota archaeon]|nr:NUDIX domain-containing protein [Candidatus Heimdallarchaeota archaeon]